MFETTELHLCWEIFCDHNFPYLSASINNSGWDAKFSLTPTFNYIFILHFFKFMYEWVKNYISRCCSYFVIYFVFCLKSYDIDFGFVGFDFVRNHIVHTLLFFSLVLNVLFFIFIFVHCRRTPWFGHFQSLIPFCFWHQT